MIEIFNKIFSYSKKNKKYDGASLEEIKHIELKLGYTLPNGFSELYGITNGARIFNCELLEIVDIINLIKNGDYVENEKLNVIPEYYVKKAITYKGRLPLFKEKNKIIFIDFDADARGINGQIVLYYDDTFKVIANNLTDFFSNLLDNIDEVYKSDLFKYLISKNVTFLKENTSVEETVKLDNNKINVEIFSPDNNIFEKEIRGKKVTMPLLKLITQSFETIIQTFKSRIKNHIIIYDPELKHSEYNYFEYNDLYNQMNFSISDIDEYKVKLIAINPEMLKNMNFTIGYTYQIDDRRDRRYINVNHRLDVFIDKDKIHIKYLFNIKEPYIYDEIIKIIEYINNLPNLESNIVFNDLSFDNLNINVINEVYDLFKTEMSKYRFDTIDKSKIDYHISIVNLLEHIKECNWIDNKYAENIIEIESKSVMELTKEELKKYFSAIIKREELESGYIAILIDRGIFDLLISKLKYYKENN